MHLTSDALLEPVSVNLAMQQLKKTCCLSLFAVFTGLASLSASAAALLLEAVDAGFYTSLGVHTPASTNYFAGVDWTGSAYTEEHRNFFVFNLSGVTERVTSATLRVWSGEVKPDPNPAEPTQTSIDYNLYSVATPVGQLIAGRDTPGNEGIFADLGTGLVLGGAFTLTGADSSTFLELVLNEKAIAELNKIIKLGGEPKEKAVETVNGVAEDDLWAIGGAMDLNTKDGIGGYAFGNTSLAPIGNLVGLQAFLQAQSPVQLFVETSSVAVPEPSTNALLALAVLGLFLSRRRLS